jgi:hypothetical protein
MAEETQNSNEMLEIISWEIPEYEKHSRTKSWYLFFGLIAVAFFIYALASANFLFAVIVVIAAFVLIMNDARSPRSVMISVTSEGIMVGRKFYDYDELQNFSIVYKPNYDIKQVYFQFKNRAKRHLSVPLLDVNPLFLRENLLNYLLEDLERTDQTSTEAISKFLKL